MRALSQKARDTIKGWDAGDDPRIQVTIAGYIRRQYSDGAWHGDSCGCIDDRCIGFHHDQDQECGCLPLWLDEWVAEQRAALEAGPIWTAYRAAVEANDGQGDPEAYEAAWTAAEAWIRRYHPTAETFSLDASVDGVAGISITNRWNDRDWLVWPAPAAAAVELAVTR